jgi:hypothetical protein
MWASFVAVDGEIRLGLRARLTGPELGDTHDGVHDHGTGKGRAAEWHP